jgi:hypothetical protein
MRRTTGKFDRAWSAKMFDHPLEVVNTKDIPPSAQNQEAWAGISTLPHRFRSRQRSVPGGCDGEWFSAGRQCGDRISIPTENPDGTWTRSRGGGVCRVTPLAARRDP